MSNFQDLQAQLIELLLEKPQEEAVAWAKQVLDSDLDILVFFENIFTPSMSSVGDKFGKMEIFLPELMDAADKAQAISDQVIQPVLAGKGDGTQITRGKIIIGSVQGDLHDIGKNMVALMLRVNGFEVVDLGVDVPVRTIIDRAKEEQTDIVGLSSLMTTSMPYMKEVVQMREGFGLKEDFNVIVGGAPITAEYAGVIGADAFGKNAVEAVEKCLALMDRPA